jgi:hypothetical protein
MKCKLVLNTGVKLTTELHRAFMAGIYSEWKLCETPFYTLRNSVVSFGKVMLSINKHPPRGALPPRYYMPHFQCLVNFVCSKTRYIAACPIISYVI